jgi:DNA ligase (NAD+)
MSLQNTTKTLQQFMQQNPSADTINKATIFPIYQQFIDCLTDHNHLYYIENNPTISDKEYDELFSYLKQIEEYFPHIVSSNSPTQNLVWQVQEWFVHATHQTPMLSLENSYSTQDILDRDEFITKHINKTTSSWKEWAITNKVEKSYKTQVSYYIEPKFDGISVEVIYKNWQFHQAITRGDGITGDDITQNVKTIKTLPKNITYTEEIYLRGEIMMPKSVRKNINEERAKTWEQPFANTRNAAAWSIKLLDTNEVNKRGLICFIYDIANNKQYNTHQQIIQKLQSLWLPIFPRHKICNNIQEVINITQDQDTLTFFQQQDIDFDGLVIKVNEQQNRDILWATQHHPRRAIAYKFPAQQISTQIISVDRQVGRSGIITPVANLNPVQLSWVTISRVSLHNSDFIKSKDIQINDYIRVQRSGEVIPYIVGVIKERREGTQIIRAPIQCPSCKHETSHIDMHTYCTNHACPAQLQEKIGHFVSKQCMDIEGVGESITALLVQQKLVTTIDQLYQFQDIQKQAILRTLPWFADKKITELAKQLEKSKSQPLRRLLHGLGIPHIGKRTAMILEENIQNAAMLQHWNVSTFHLSNLISYLTNGEFLTKIHGIGEKMIQALQSFFHDQTNITILQNLVNTWINISPFDTNKNSSSPFAWQHFAITGTFPVSRDQIIAACEAQGMIFDPSPTKQSSYMFIGENPWSKKAKAEEYNIPLIYSQEQLMTQFPFLSIIIKNKWTQWSKNIRKPTSQSLF